MEMSQAQTDSPYRRAIDTEVLETREVSDGGGRQVRLAETVFYAEGGGQPADTGTIDGAAVRDVQRDEEGRIWHLLAAESAPPEEGAEVAVEIDWARRFDHMQQHTAQHLITAIADDEFELPTVSFHLGEDYSSIDLDVGRLSRKKLRALEHRVNEEIRAARPVGFRQVAPEEYDELDLRSRGLPDDHSGAVRLVEIEGLDLNTCGGTHVSNTAQLQSIKLIGAESTRERVRLSYLAGGRVLQRLGICLRREGELNEVLSCGPDEHVEAVERVMQDAQAAGQQLRGLREELAELLALRLADGSERVVELHRDEPDFEFLNAIARRTLEADVEGEKVVFLTAAEPGEQRAGIFLVAGPGELVDEVGVGVAERLEGRGGGPPGIYQGKAERLDRREEVIKFLHTHLDS